MFGVGPEEIAVILLVAMLVLGPDKMPKLARDLGKLVGDLRRTSDELREEFLNSDKLIDKVAELPQTAATPVPGEVEAAPVLEPVAGDVPVEAVPEPAVGATQADMTGAVVEDETETDRDAREARERLADPERAKKAAAEGWTVPKDHAGTNDRWG